MSTAMINPLRDLIPLTSAGGLDASLSPVPRAFMITEDEAISVVTATGRTRVYPQGTFNIKTIYPMLIQKVNTTGTSVAAAKIFLGFDVPPAV